MTWLLFLAESGPGSSRNPPVLPSFVHAAACIVSVRKPSLSACIRNWMTDTQFFFPRSSIVGPWGMEAPMDSYISEIP